MLGDVLKRRVSELKDTTDSKGGNNPFWKKLRDIAREEILDLAPSKVDSNRIIPVYYKILSQNLDCLPEGMKRTIPSNNQERYRVAIRNLFSTNVNNYRHPEGLANQPGIKAYQVYNSDRRGKKTVYQGEVDYVSKERFN